MKDGMLVPSEAEVFPGIAANDNNTTDSRENTFCNNIIPVPWV